MIFINKALNQQQGHALVTAFLASRWDTTNNCYTEIGYDSSAFRNQLRLNLRQLLLQEQNNRCCYCMRNILEQETTLEHIVPKSTTTPVGFNQYSHHTFIRNYVCLQSEFDNSNVFRGTPTFPLEIAYENLVASCNGVFPGGRSTYQICNHKRKNNLIEPLFYITTIGDDIIYLKAGLVSSTNNIYNTTITTLNLNYDSLEKIRQVWYHLSLIPLADILVANTEMLRTEILVLNIAITDLRRKTQLVNDYKNESLWNNLLKYQWFHNYYLTKYPKETR